ncbi:unnamed protein product, partial [Didymodactylos carnosus]
VVNRSSTKSVRHGKKTLEEVISAFSFLVDAPVLRKQRGKKKQQDVSVMSSSDDDDD